MGIQLTKDDVFSLLKNNDINSKIGVTRKICQTFTQGLYSEEELELAEEIICILAKDAEEVVRATLSEALKYSTDLPHDVAVSLAKDVESVSLPIIEFSTVLNDTDLLDILFNANVQKMMAMSRRKKLSHTVARGLINKNIDSVTQSLLNNDDFTDNKEEFEKFIDVCADNKNMMKSIVMNSALPLQITEKLLYEISGNIISSIKEKYHITPLKLTKYVDHSVEISLLSVIDHNSSDDGIEHLVEHLYTYGKLTPSLVLSSACMGRKRFFIAAIAKMADIPINNARKLIANGGTDGLHSLLAQAGIPSKLFDAVELVLGLMNEKKSREPEIGVYEFCGWLIHKLEYHAEKQFIDYIAYMIGMAKQVHLARKLVG